MKLLLNVVTIAFLANMSNIVAATVIGESAALVRFAKHAENLRKFVETKTYVPVGREDFPLQAKTKSRVFGQNVEVVTVEEYSGAICRLKDDLRNTDAARQVLRNNERYLNAQKSVLSGNALEETERDLAKVAKDISRATFIMHSNARLVEELSDAYDKKNYPVILCGKVTRNNLMAYVKTTDPEFFKNSQQHHEAVLSILLPTDDD